MILINLLPPELRKRRAGINPVVASLAAAGVAAVLLGAALAYIHFVCIPNAERELAARIERETQLTAEMAKIEEMKKRLADIDNRNKALQALFDKKMYWARVIDDLCTVFTSPFLMPDEKGREPHSDSRAFEVRCTEMAMQRGTARGPAGRGAAEEVTAQVKLKLRLVTDNRGRSIRLASRFFDSVNDSDWWKRHGFVGRPVDVMPALKPEWRKDIQREVLDLPLDVVRRQTVKDVASAARVREAGGKGTR